MNRRSKADLPPADALPSEPAPAAEHECMRCHKGRHELLWPRSRARAA
jgi:hypothetical protein